MLFPAILSQTRVRFGESKWIANKDWKQVDTVYKVNQDPPHARALDQTKKSGSSNSGQQRKKGQVRRPPMCAVSTISLSLSEPSFRGPFWCHAYQRGSSVSCALLARGSSEIKSWFCVHPSRSFRESALSWAGEAVRLPCFLFLFRQNFDHLPRQIAT